MNAPLERLSAAESDDCAHGSVMSASQSQLPSQKPSTTALARGRKWWRGAAGRRERCTRRTTLYGARRHLSGKRPAPLSEVTGPQAAVTDGYVAAGVPLLGVPSLADSSAEAIDGSTLSFLLQRALEVKRKEEEEAVEAAELVELEEKLAAAEERLLAMLRRDREEGTRITPQTWSSLSRVEQFAVHWSWPRRRLGRRGKRGRRRRGGGCGRLAGLCSAALRDVSYDSLLVGFYGFFSFLFSTWYSDPAVDSRPAFWVRREEYRNRVAAIYGSGTCLAGFAGSMHLVSSVLVGGLSAVACSSWSCWYSCCCCVPFDWWLAHVLLDRP